MHASTSTSWKTGPAAAGKASRGFPASSPAWHVLVWRLTHSRPAIAWSLALLFAFKGLICFATVAFPITGNEPKALIAGIGLTAFAAAAVTWLGGNRVSPNGVALLAALGTLANSGLIARAQTHGGMMIAAFAYPWTAIYAAHFFSRRVVLALAALITVSFGAALIASGLPHVVVYWLVVMLTIWSICILMSSLSASVRREVNTDRLTGVLNRNGFIAAASRVRTLANRTGEPLTLAVIDLDDFKQVNDQAGHAAGDTLLAALARGWRDRIRPSDVLARHGGDEFVLLLPSTTREQAEAALGRLRSADDPVGWSTGTSEWQRGEKLDAVLARADQSLYDAKLAKPGVTLGDYAA